MYNRNAENIYRELIAGNSLFKEKFPVWEEKVKGFSPGVIIVGKTKHHLPPQKDAPTAAGLNVSRHTYDSPTARLGVSIKK